MDTLPDGTASASEKELWQWLRMSLPGVGPKVLKVYRSSAEHHIPSENSGTLSAQWRWSMYWWYDAAMAGQKKALHRLTERNQAHWREWFHTLWPGKKPHELRACLGEPSCSGTASTFMLVSIMCWACGAVRRADEDRCRGANFMAAFLDAFLCCEEQPLVITLPMLHCEGEVSLTVNSGWVDTLGWLPAEQTTLAEAPATDFARQLIEDYRKASEGSLSWLEGDIRKCKLSHLACMLLADPTHRRGKQAAWRSSVACHLMRQLAMLIDLRVPSRTVLPADLGTHELALKTDQGNLKRKNSDLKAHLSAEAQKKKVPHCPPPLD